MPKTVQVKIKKEAKKKKTPQKVEPKPKAIKPVSKTKKIDLKVNNKSEVVEAKKIEPQAKNVISKIKSFKFNKAKKVYLITSAIIILISVVLLIIPILPTVGFKLNPINPDIVDYQLPVSSPFKVKENAKAIPETNRLVIPKASVDTPIVEGTDIGVLNTTEGVLRESFGKTPLQKGNMTLAGHRFQYLPPNMTTLYNLDMLTEGDNILVFWEGKVYTYQVYSVFEVTPDRVDILNDSNIEHELTIYTCTPIYTSTHRLVVKAKLVL